MKEIVAGLTLILFFLYMAFATFVFEWRNPKANRMSLVREFTHVVKFEKMEKYQ